MPQSARGLPVSPLEKRSAADRGVTLPAIDHKEQPVPPPSEVQGPVHPTVCLPWQRCLFAILAVAAAAVVRNEFLDFLGPHLPYVTFLPAVLASCLYCGASAGLLATFLSVGYVSFCLDTSLDQILIIHGATERLVAAFSILSCAVLGLVAWLLHNDQSRIIAAEHQAKLAYERSRIEASLRESEARYQEQILALNAGLEQRVRERTAELEAAIREQESFSYSVSHDLRAPLRHINSFSSILMEEYAADLPDEARNYLERIKGASKSLGAKIDHLLELSRLSRTELKREWVDLGQAAAGIAAMLRETEPQRCVELSIEEGLLVRGDRALLGQLLENLLGNAWKYSSVQPSAHIAFGKSCADGQDSFFVKDDGVGFDMAYSGKLFEVFERLHGAQFEGTGIGLATAQRIVQRHGGEIWAEGKVGAGATFFFTLSSAAVDANQPPPPPPLS